MGGSNPYIEEVKYKPATKTYKVTFLPSGKTIEVDPEKIPYGHNGLPGSILDISEGIKAGLDHACGGVCACSTCHVVVKEGLESCNEATDAELDELDEAPGITPKSRLGCQTVPDGTTDIVVEIPEWNKNYAKEADHYVDVRSSRLELGIVGAAFSPHVKARTTGLLAPDARKLFPKK